MEIGIAMKKRASFLLQKIGYSHIGRTTFRFIAINSEGICIYRNCKELQEEPYKDLIKIPFPKEEKDLEQYIKIILILFNNLSDTELETLDRLLDIIVWKDLICKK